MSLPVVDLSKVKIDHEALRLVSYQTCENNDLIPIQLTQQGHSRQLTLAMADPMNIAVIDELEFTSGCKIRPVLATISAIQSAIRKYYRGQNTQIKPLSLQKTEHSDTGRMVLVRPGGETEQVDTSTYTEKSKVLNLTEEVKEEPEEVSSEVARIKARRAAIRQRRGTPITSDQALADYLREVQTSEWETLQKLEKYFWALMRVMARKGLVTKEEFLRELGEK